MFDAHLHLRDERLRPTLERLEREALQAGVTACIDCAVNPDQWAYERPSALEVTPAYGLHPWFTANPPKDWLYQLNTLLTQHPNALVGEIGRDGIRPTPDNGAAQHQCLTAQLDLAVRHERPIVCHGARAWGELFNTLISWIDRLPAVLLHGVNFAPEWLNSPLFKRRNIWFSIGGALLTPGAKTLPKLAQRLPLNRLLVETDSPDMFPHGGEPLILGQPQAPLNHPGNLPLILSALARLRNCPLPELTQQTIANANALLRS